MRFMIAGLGSMGRRHLRNLRALGETDILLYRTHRSSLPDSDLAGIPAFDDLTKALAQKPDAVIISNPTAAHMSIALPASAAGCHLLIEKPISHNMGDIPQLRANLAKTGKHTLMGFHFRYHPVLQQVRVMLDSGRLGEPLSVHAHWGEYLPDWHPWEDYRQAYAARADLGGGVVLTLSHPFDYLCWLIGEVDALSATVGKVSPLDIGVEDHADINLHFTRGCLGSVHLDYYQRPAAHWLEITTEGGFIRWQNTSGSAKIYTVADNNWVHLDPPQGFERNDLFLAEMAHFISVCKEQTTPGCDLEDGIRALEIALAVHQSSLQGSRLVSLS